MESLEKKIRCAKRFSEEVTKVFGPRLYKVDLFGGVAKGFADESSDIDVVET